MDRQKLLNAISDQVPGLLVVYNIITGEYLYVNNAIKKTLGYEPEDFINGGMKFAFSLVHPDDMPELMEKNNKALEYSNGQINPKPEEEIAVSFEYRMKHK